MSIKILLTVLVASSLLAVIDAAREEPLFEVCDACIAFLNAGHSFLKSQLGKLGVVCKRFKDNIDRGVCERYMRTVSEDGAKLDAHEACENLGFCSGYVQIMINQMCRNQQCPSDDAPESTTKRPCTTTTRGDDEDCDLLDDKSSAD